MSTGTWTHAGHEDTQTHRHTRIKKNKTYYSKENKWDKDAKT